MAVVNHSLLKAAFGPSSCWEDAVPFHRSRDRMASGHTSLRARSAASSALSSSGRLHDSVLVWYVGQLNLEFAHRNTLVATLCNALELRWAGPADDCMDLPCLP